MSDDKRFGTLYCIGVGPGDPELLTLKAARIIKSSPVIFTPKAEGTCDSIAFDIAKQYIDPTRQKIVHPAFPIGVGKPPDEVWDAAVEDIASYLRSGDDVAFLAQGDPMVYSSASYIMEKTKARHPEFNVESVPAVTSITAAAARAQFPLLSHGERLAVWPAMYGLDNLKIALEQYDTIVLMKVNRQAIETVLELKAEGFVKSATLVTKATTPQEKVVYDIDSIANEKPQYFSLMVISGRRTP